MAGFTEEESKRKTQHPLLPGAIAEFNQYEFSRAMRHKDCINPLRIFSHIAPYMGGPEKIMNTNGAGDGALAALLHDITANAYHKTNVPNSSKHTFDWLTYSSLAQVCKYANRVSYQVLNQHSPRLTRGCRNGKTASKRRTGTGKVKRQPVVAVLVFVPSPCERGSG